MMDEIFRVALARPVSSRRLANAQEQLSFKGHHLRRTQNTTRRFIGEAYLGDQLPRDRSNK
jgi:hypothetical protein